MRTACVYVHGLEAGVLEEHSRTHYIFKYCAGYQGAPVSLTMPIIKKQYDFDEFPPFFEGLLPEGVLLEALLRKHKLDKSDYFGQLIHVGHDVIGAISIQAML